MKGLTPHHKTFLIKETLLSVVVNALLTLIMSYAIFHSRDSVPFWGRGGLVMDMGSTIFFVCFGMTMVLTPVVRMRIQKGGAPSADLSFRNHPVWKLFFPTMFFFRAVMLAMVSVMILLPVSAGLMVLWKSYPVPLNLVLAFKTFYGGFLGLVVTPFILMGAMSDISLESDLSR